MPHDVVYVHDCPKTGHSYLHVIQYNDDKHEAENLRSHEEHVCRYCRGPQKRLGAAAELRRKGDGEAYLDPSFYMG